jgi:uncharacterized membrane protein
VRCGTRVFGLGVMALGLICIAFGDFDFGQSVPKAFPARTPLAYVAAAFMFVAGAGVQWQRTLKWAAAALAVYFGVIVFIVMDGRVIVANYSEYGTYSSVAAQVAIAAAALVIYADPRFARTGQVIFGLCAVLFGGAHFFYMNLTAPLVPHWLPGGGEFWGYATGIAHIAAGIALLANIQARLAMVLLTIMYASFTPLIHVPMLLAEPSSRFIWSENALNIILTGVAWVMADSLARRN